MNKIALVIVLIITLSVNLIQAQNKQPVSLNHAESGFTNAVDFGFSPEASGIENAMALQRAVDQTGTIIVSRPGTYKMASTSYIGSNTSLIFSTKVFLKKSDLESCLSLQYSLFHLLLQFFAFAFYGYF